MFISATTRCHPAHVMAIFADGADFLPLPQGSTPAELANRIDKLGARLMHALTAIEIHFHKPAPHQKAAASQRQQSFV